MNNRNNVIIISLLFFNISIISLIWLNVFLFMVCSRYNEIAEIKNTETYLEINGIE